MFREALYIRAGPGPSRKQVTRDTWSTGRLRNTIMAVVMKVNRRPPEQPFSHFQLGSQILVSIQDRDKTALLCIHSQRSGHLLGRVERRRHNGKKSLPNWDQHYFEPCLYLTRHVTPGRFLLFVNWNFSSESGKKDDLQAHGENEILR